MIGKVQRVCCVCGIRLPDERREDLIKRGCGTQLGTGQVLFHCPHHPADEILKMINATPIFQTGKDYRKYANE